MAILPVLARFGGMKASECVVNDRERLSDNEGYFILELPLSNFSVSVPHCCRRFSCHRALNFLEIPYC